MIKRGIFTDDKRSKLKKVNALILHRIDCQLIVDKSHVLGGLKMKHRPYKFTDFSSSNFSGLFRFRSPADLQRLHDGFGLPDIVKVQGYKTTGEEILMISLVRLSYPHRWEDVERIFPSTSSTMGQRREMSSSGWLLKHVEVDFIFIVAKVLINKLNELFRYKCQKQPIFFCKSRNSTHTDFSFFARFASQSRAKSGKSFIFYAY